MAFADASEEAISSFSQADVNAGRVIYRDGIGDIVLPEIRADSFLFSVSDGAGNGTGPRSFLMLRDLPEFGPDDGTTVWRAGDGDAFLDGGEGDDAFVLRGTDGDDDVLVQPSADGTGIVMTVGGAETVTLDGFEDLYFMMGNGSNSVEISGDFSNTDLSPSRVIYRGGSEDDHLFWGEDSPLIPGVRYDYVITLGPGDNRITLQFLRASFVIGYSENDRIFINGKREFQHVVFAQGGDNLAVYPRADPSFHVDEFHGSRNVYDLGGVKPPEGG